jgi:TRAP-type C4-dicarboxylate transport system substrate-binding protein
LYLFLKEEKMMKKLSVLFFVSVIILLVISSVISCTPKAKEAVILRLTMAQPGGDDPAFLSTSGMAEKFNERAGGEYSIKVYPAETLVKMYETIDAVRTGAVEMANVAWGAFGGLDPRIGACELPFLFDNVRANAAAQEPMLPLWSKVFEEKFNQKALGSFTVCGLELISKRPVKTMEDWKGLMVGTISPVTATMTELLGGSSVVIVWTEAYSNLEKGVIDATTQGTTWMIVGKLTDVAKYVTLFYGVPTSHGYTINLDVWNAMPKNIQDILAEEVKRAAAEYNEKNIQFAEVEHPAQLEALGCDIYTLPKAERDKWKAAVQPLLDEQLSALGEFGQELRQIADRINAENP